MLRFGEMPTCKPLRAWLAGLDDAAQLVVDPLRGWNEPTRSAGAIVRADPAPLARGAGRARLGEQREPSWAERWLAAAARRAAGDRARSSTRSSEPSEPGVCARARRASTPTATSSTPPRACRSATRRRSCRRATPTSLFLANRGANGIDGLVSSGIGAAAASGRPTWIVTGDLGLFHDMNALARAARTRTAPVRIVVLNNDGGGIFEFLPQAEQVEREEFEALLGTPLGLEPERVAALYGPPVPARRATSAELADAATRHGVDRGADRPRARTVALHRRAAAMARRTQRRRAEAL